MIRLIIVVCAFVMASYVSGAHSGGTAGDTYHGHEMAPYTTDPDFKDKPYEKRFYPSVKWVATKYGCAGWFCNPFWKLFSYISGSNSRGVKIAMTVPVLNEVHTAPSKTGGKERVMLFYIPEEFQKNTPQPLDSDVYIHTMSNMTIYSKIYSGWSYTAKELQELGELKAMLKKDGMSFVSDFYVTAGYDGPMSWRKRRNEVWLLANGK